MSARDEYVSRMNARDEFGGYAWGMGDMVMGRTQYAAAMNELDRLRVERDTLTAENRLMRALLKVPGASNMRKIDGWYWCTTDAEFVSAARRCSGADPTLCSLVPIYVRPREEGKQ